MKNIFCLFVHFLNFVKHSRTEMHCQLFPETITKKGSKHFVYISKRGAFKPYTSSIDNLRL